MTVSRRDSLDPVRLEGPPFGHPGTPDTLASFVAEEIRQRIVLGEIAGGEHLPVYSLAEELGISRVPLREAVRQLEAEGLVDNRPRRGAVVRPLSLADLEDCFGMLGHIEPIAVRRASGQVTPQMVADLRRWSAEMDRCSHRRVSREMLEAHWNLHFTLFDRLGDGIMLRVLRILWYTSERYVMHCMPDPAREERARLEHLKLIELVTAGDGDAASTLMKAHIKGALVFCRKYLRREGAADRSD